MHDLKASFALNPEITFLNHGSFGACPLEILAEQDLWRRRLEAEPIRFMLRTLPRALAESRECLAEFVRAQAADLVFVNNATEAVNAVLRSYPFEPGDEIITTDQVYNACRNVLDYVAHKNGLKIVNIEIPLPMPDSHEIVRLIGEAMTTKTRLALLDHITSPSALILPIEELVPLLQGAGVDVLVDGAHGPGMLPLDLDKLGAAYYTGNLHKWVCGPKAAAFLHARRDRQEGLRPAVISHGANTPLEKSSRYQVEFDWAGTRDYSAVLCLPKTLKLMASFHVEGWPGIMKANRDLIEFAVQLFERELGLSPLAPKSARGSIASFRLADGDSEAADPFAIDPQQEWLYRERQIEVPIMPFPAPCGRVLRISAQLYNSERDYEHLVSSLKECTA